MADRLHGGISAYHSKGFFSFYKNECRLMKRKEIVKGGIITLLLDTYSDENAKNIVSNTSDFKQTQVTRIYAILKMLQ